MKKIISFALLLTLCVSLITGCHGTVKTSGFEVPDDFDTERQYAIMFWAKNDSNVTQKNIIQKAISDFEAIYPNITVEIKWYTDYKTIYNDVITNIATQTTPNLCITYPDHVATYLTGNNTVVSLDTLINNEKYGLGGSEVLFDAPTKEEIIPKFLEECSFDGSYYAIPFVRSSEACYVNINMVEALGYTLPDILTWDFIWEVSEKAMEKNEDGTFKLNGQNVLIPFIYKSTDNMMIQMLKQKNGDYSTANGDILIFNDTTKSILSEIYPHAKSAAFSTFARDSYPGNYFNAGQCIFAIDSTAGATWIGSHAPQSDIPEENIREFETAVLPVPQYDTVNPQMISQGPSLCIFNKEDSQEVLATWLFAQYLLTNETQIDFSTTEGYVPVTSKAQESDEYKDYLSRRGEDADHYAVKIDAAKLVIDNINNTFVTEVFNGSASLRQAAGQMIEEVLKYSRNKKNPPVDDEYFDELYKKMISRYKLQTTK